MTRLAVPDLSDFMLDALELVELGAGRTSVEAIMQVTGYSWLDCLAAMKSLREQELVVRRYPLSGQFYYRITRQGLRALRKGRRRQARD
jgi:uncharacterized protein YjhX (UPF0386 family)